MLIKCPACDVECTVENDSTATVTCPGCGQTLQSATNSVTGSVVPAPDDQESADASQITRKWNLDDVETLLDETKLPCRIGRYEIRRRLASGGFATVFQAHDTELQRDVALKVPRRDRCPDDERLTAVMAEARLAARLRHPGIVTIYDVGMLTAGLPCIAMEFVPGETLRQLLSRGQPEFTRTAELLIQIAEAAHYAHQQNLVHRDLKPGNVLLDERGQARIVDFGLALDEAEQFDQSGDMAGTPSYMAPEQVRGESHRFDGRTDIWALGVILYEMLCGRRPFVGPRVRLFDEIENREPKPPRQINDQIPIELEEICLKCLAKKVPDRFRTSLDLAEALRGWLEASLSGGADSNRQQSSTGVFRLPSMFTGGDSSRSGSRRSAKENPQRVPPSAMTLISSGTLMTALVGLVLSAMGAFTSRTNDADPGNGRIAEKQDNQAQPFIWKANRWYDVLDHDPAEIMWTAIAVDSARHWDPDSRRMNINCAHPAGLRCGTTHSGAYRLELRFSQSGAGGDTGLVYGAHRANGHDGFPGTRFQILYLKSFHEDGRLKHRICRDDCFTWTPPGGPSPLLSRSHLATHELDPQWDPNKKLEVRVTGGQTMEVYFNGKFIDSLEDGPHLRPLIPLVGTGGFGLWNEGGGAVFHELRIQLLDGESERQD